MQHHLHSSLQSELFITPDFQSCFKQHFIVSQCSHAVLRSVPTLAICVDKIYFQAHCFLLKISFEVGSRKGVLGIKHGTNSYLGAYLLYQDGCWPPGSPILNPSIPTCYRVWLAHPISYSKLCSPGTRLPLPQLPSLCIPPFWLCQSLSPGCPLLVSSPSPFTFPSHDSGHVHSGLSQMSL